MPDDRLSEIMGLVLKQIELSTGTMESIRGLLVAQAEQNRQVLQEVQDLRQQLNDLLQNRVGL